VYCVYTYRWLVTDNLFLSQERIKRRRGHDEVEQECTEVDH